MIRIFHSYMKPDNGNSGIVSGIFHKEHCDLLNYGLLAGVVGKLRASRKILLFDDNLIVNLFYSAL
jgi:hypothetical protein